MQQGRVVRRQWRTPPVGWSLGPAGWSAGRAWRSAALALALSGVQALDPSQARAGEPTDAIATAESQVLFDEGMKLAAAGKYGEACPKLAASMKIEPEIGTRYYLGDCYEHEGKLASAYALFRDVEESAKKKDQKAAARTRATALEPRLVRVSIDVPEDLRKIPGLVVQRGGVTLSTGQLGTAVPVDPGPIAISATAPGKKRWEMSLAATKEGATLTVQVPTLEDSPNGATAPPTVTPAAPSPRSDAPAYVAGSVGAVSVILGGVLVGTAEGKRAEVRSSLPLDSTGKTACGQSAAAGAAPGSICDELRATAGSANTLGNTGIALFAIGGVAIAGAVVYLVWQSKPAAPAKHASVLLPVIAADGGGLRWTGSF
jgi:hypothetical protein